MLDKGQVEPGTTVWLRAGTKTAPAICYTGMSAVFVSDDHWPYVTVRVFEAGNDGHGRETDLHKDNIRLTRKTIKKDKQGDMAGSNVDENAKPPKPRKHAIDPASGYAEGVLF